MEWIKKWLNRFFIDGLSGMTIGLFCTLIIGTILQQIGSLITGEIGSAVFTVGKVAELLTGAGIGCGVAYKLKEPPLVVLSALTAGMVGAFASNILSGAVIVNNAVKLAGAGEPLGAFLAAYVGIEVGHLIAGKTKMDIFLTPLVVFSAGSATGLLLGPPISEFMKWIGAMINWGTEQQPLLMGVIVSVLMGIFSTLPVGSVAIGVMLNLSGIAAGAATVGCCANMVGFAAASYKDNQIGGVAAQGLGTSMLQLPNIVRKPLIWLPAILTSAILGPISAVVLKMTNHATGSGMGTLGLIGQFTTYQTMTSQGADSAIVMIEIAIMHFIAPAVLAFVIAKTMRKWNIIKNGDMKLQV